jgi:hypothetical protein
VTDFFKTITKEDKVTQWVLLFYGVSGTMKTRTAAQLPDPLFLSSERGILGGLVSAREFNPKQVKIDSYRDFLNVLPKLRSEANKAFKTIIFDSLTAFQHLLMKDVLGTKEIPTQPDWNLFSIRLRSTINTVASLGVHCVYIAGEQVISAEDSDKQIGVPAIQSKVSSQIIHGVDIALRFTSRPALLEGGVKGTQFVMKAQPDGIWPAKDSSGLLPAEMLTPSGGSHFNHLKALFG